MVIRMNKAPVSQRLQLLVGDTITFLAQSSTHTIADRVLDIVVKLLQGRSFRNYGKEPSGPDQFLLLILTKKYPVAIIRHLPAAFFIGNAVFPFQPQQIVGMHTNLSLQLPDRVI